jgi:hypothetical protein
LATVLPESNSEVVLESSWKLPELKQMGYGKNGKNRKNRENRKIGK